MARDLIYQAVKDSLINDGWEITDDPFKIRLEEDNRTLEADLGAEKMLAASKGTEKIIVEIKTFGGTSVLNKFHTALGQYLDYRDAIAEANIQRELFLAVSVNTYAEMRELNFIRRQINRYQLKFITVNLDNNSIQEWIK